MSEDDINEAIRLASELCREFEGFRSQPYLCPAKKATVGYGSTVYPDGSAVKLSDDPVTLERAEAMLRYDLRVTRLPAVLHMCPEIDTPGRLAALLDFAYNAGLGAMGRSTLRKLVNERRWEEVPNELRKWVHGGGRQLPGLVRRREAEAKLINPA